MNFIYNIFFLLIFVSVDVFSQPTIDWARHYTGPGNNTDNALDVITDQFNNIYITGYSYSGSAQGNDIVTIKYLPNGDSAWVRIFATPGNTFDLGNSLTILNNFVYITGGNTNFLKYDLNGNFIFSRYDSLSTGPKMRIISDSSKYLYCCGKIRINGTYGFGVIKYDSVGNLIWKVKYLPPTEDNNSEMHDAVKDSESNIILTGSAAINYSYPFWDILTIKIKPNGDTAWMRTYNGDWGGTQGFDEAYGVDVDDSNNVYVTGASKDSNFLFTYVTLKYSPFGELKWVKRFSIGGSGALDIKVDRNNDLIICGETSSNYTTVKYDRNGNLLWSRTQICGELAPVWPVIYLDSLNNAIIAQTTITTNGGRNFSIVKYSPTGDLLWQALYPNTGSTALNSPEAITMDNEGKVIVTGRGTIMIGQGGTNCLTIKISQPLGITKISNEIPK
ncbi:MAG TPA: hypothetical protein VJ455_09055, partial [Ignavibacteria bacterium]|nr:hypothetical protein [Ignavibacteria bacterium]